MLSEVKIWWDRLTKKEKELLLGFLYDLNLEEYGIMVNEKTWKYERSKK